MHISQVAAQLYTVREHTKTAADFAASMRKVRAIGYQAVQLSAVGPIPVEELARILAGEGLICCSTHEGNILTETAKVVERLRKLNCRYTAYPYPGVKLDTVADVKALAAQLNAAGKMFAEAGQVLTYHNHNVEFRRYGKQTMLEILYAEMDPALVQGEIDTYWVQYGGGNSEDWCRKLRGRLPLMHLKDYVTTAENKPTMTEIGNGNLNWPAIVAAADEAGCKWFMIEQDICPGDPFDSLKQSFEYLKSEICR